MLKKTLFILASLILLISLGLATRHFSVSRINNNTNINTALLYKASLIDTQGTKQNLNQYKGKIIVLNFWATWCPPCREEMPELSRLYQEFQK